LRLSKDTSKIRIFNAEGLGVSGEIRKVSKSSGSFFNVLIQTRSCVVAYISLQREESCLNSTKKASCTTHMDIRIFGFPHIAGSPMLSPPAIYKCLSDETRARATLLITREGELCVCELVCALDDSQPKISRHLAQLRACGLLIDRRQGQWVYYRLNPELPAWVRAVLETTLQANTDWLEENSARLKQMGDRPLNTAACC
jgi:ArsR family transcriptional regulator